MERRTFFSHMLGMGVAVPAVAKIIVAGEADLRELDRGALPLTCLGPEIECTSLQVCGKFITLNIECKTDEAVEPLVEHCKRAMKQPVRMPTGCLAAHWIGGLTRNISGLRNSEMVHDTLCRALGVHEMTRPGVERIEPNKLRIDYEGP